MKVKLIQCTGFEPAMLGSMLSYGKTSLKDLELFADTKTVRPEIQERFDALKDLIAKGIIGEKLKSLEKCFKS